MSTPSYHTKLEKLRFHSTMVFVTGHVTGLAAALADFAPFEFSPPLDFRFAPISISKIFSRKSTYKSRPGSHKWYKWARRSIESQRRIVQIMTYGQN